MPPAKQQAAAPLLSIKQAATRLGVCTKTLIRWIEAGDLPAFKIGRQWRISRKDLDQYLNDRYQGGSQGVF